MTRTLPLRVTPAPGEALDSWLEAVAVRHEALPGEGIAMQADAKGGPGLAVGLEDVEGQGVEELVGHDGVVARRRARGPGDVLHAGVRAHVDARPGGRHADGLPHADANWRAH